VPKFVADSSVSPTGLKWAAPAAGGGDFTLISRTSFSAVAGQNFDDVFDTTYAAYRVIIETIFSSVAGDSLKYQTRVGGSTRTTSYYGGVGGASYNSASFQGGASTDNGSSLQLTFTSIGSDVGTAAHLSFDVYQAGVSSQSRLAGTGIQGQNGHALFFGGYRLGTEDVDGFRLTASTGDLTGTVAIYGYGV
jgi:hypothetical protein